MEHLNDFIIDLSLITIVAGTITLIFRKFKFPLVLGYIAAGFLISPNFVWLPTILQYESIKMWAEIGIIFLMFAIGLKFSFKKIADVGQSAFVTAINVMTAMVFIGYLLGNLLGFSKIDSIFLGCMMSISSTMIIMKSYDEYDLRKEKFANLVLGTMIVEDIIAIFMMIVLSAVSLGQNLSGFHLLSKIGILLVMLVIWLVIGIYLIPTLLNKTKKLINDEVLLIVSLGICFGMVIIANFIGFSAALGAFIGGSILGGTLSGDRINKLVSPIRDLFVAIFFVSVGMMIEPMILIKYIWPILIISLAVILGQMIFSVMGMLLSGQGLQTSIRGGFSMVQIGEFSFVIAAMGNTIGVTSNILYPIIVCVSVLTIFVTPLFIKHSKGAYEKIKDLLPKKAEDFLKKFTSERRGASNKDSDWKKFIWLYLIRTGIAIAALFAIFYFVNTKLVPYLDNHYPDYFVKIIIGVIILLLIIPIIGIMGVRRSPFFTKLWVKNKYNRLPLIALRAIRIIIAIFLLSAIYRSLLSVPFWALFPIATVIIYFSIRSDFLKGQAIKMEAQFVSNFNERVLDHWKAEYKQEGKRPWLSDRLFVGEFKILEGKENLTFANLFDKRFFNILPIKIIRKGKHIKTPDREDLLKAGDVVHIASNREHLESFLIKAERAAHIEKESGSIVSIKEYMYREVFDRIPAKDQVVCVAILINKDTPFVKKSIRNSDIRKNYLGVVVGIEKSGTLPILMPSISTILEVGDIVWVMGNEAMVNKLLKDGVMEEYVK